MRTLGKLLLLGSLYLAQGLPFGFFTQALPVLLREQGLSLPLIGLAQLLSLPWALKFLWAPFVDRVHAPRFGRRRAVIVPLQLASVVVMGVLAFVSGPEALGVLAAAVLVINAISATQDIATDGLAVEILAPDERGLGNGLQVGAYRVGMIIGGGFVLWLFARTDWMTAFLAMAGFLTLSTIPVLAFREAPRPPDPPHARIAGAIGKAFARLGPWIAVLATFKTGEWFATGMLRAFLTDSHQSLEDIAAMLGLVGFSCALVGAMAGGALTRVLGRRTALLAFGCAQTVAIAAMTLAVIWPSQEVFYLVVAGEHVTSSMATAALFTAMMDMCRTSDAGTDYTVQASLVVIASGVASALSGVSAGGLGYAGHFAVAAALSATGVVVVALYRPRTPDLALVR